MIGFEAKCRSEVTLMNSFCWKNCISGGGELKAGVVTLNERDGRAFILKIREMFVTTCFWVQTADFSKSEQESPNGFEWKY